MTALVDAYQSSAIPEFERILRTHRAAIMADPFIAQYVEDLLRNVRIQASMERGGGGWGACLGPGVRLPRTASVGMDVEGMDG